MGVLKKFQINNYFQLIGTISRDSSGRREITLKWVGICDRIIGRI